MAWPQQRLRLARYVQPSCASSCVGRPRIYRTLGSQSCLLFCVTNMCRPLLNLSFARVKAFMSGCAATDSSSQALPDYLVNIVPPVLACFTDQDARVRYYACEAMYNIAKVAKGEILTYFNSIFDQLCKVCFSAAFFYFFSSE